MKNQTTKIVFFFVTIVCIKVPCIFATLMLCFLSPLIPRLENRQRIHPFQITKTQNISMRQNWFDFLCWHTDLAHWFQTLSNATTHHLAPATCSTLAQAATGSSGSSNAASRRQHASRTTVHLATGSVHSATPDSRYGSSNDASSATTQRLRQHITPTIPRQHQ